MVIFYIICDWCCLDWVEKKIEDLGFFFCCGLVVVVVVVVTVADGRGGCGWCCRCFLVVGYIILL